MIFLAYLLGFICGFLLMDWIWGNKIQEKANSGFRIPVRGKLYIIQEHHFAGEAENLKKTIAAAYASLWDKRTAESETEVVRRTILILYPTVRDCNLTMGARHGD